MIDRGMLRSRGAALLAAGLLALSGAAAAGCDGDDAEQEIEDAANDVGSEVDQAADDVDKATQGAQDDISEAADDVGDEAEQAGQDLKNEIEGNDSEKQGADDSGN